MVNSILAQKSPARGEEPPATDPAVHHMPKGFSDCFALGFTKLLRLCADTFFAKRYGPRALDPAAVAEGGTRAIDRAIVC